MCNPVTFRTQLLHTATSLDEKAQCSAERVRILTNDELSLKVICMQHEVKERITRALSSKYDKFEVVTHEDATKVKNNDQSTKGSVEHSLYMEIEYTTIFGEFKMDLPESNLPQHHCIDLLEKGCFLEPVLCKSMRIDENIIGNKLHQELPKLSVTVYGTDEKDLDYCLHAPMRGIGLAQFRKHKPCIKYLATAGLADCHAIIFWDRIKKRACMAHFIERDMCQESFDLMLASMNDSCSSNLRMFAVGGHTHKMTRSCSFFKFIEKYATSKNIEILQTFLGNHGKRPSDVIFDVESGVLFELVIKENTTKHKLGLFDANEDHHGEQVCFKNNSGRGIKYRFADEKNKDLLIPVSVEFSVRTS